MHSKFYELISLSYDNHQMTVRLASLVEGEPNGMIGLPLIIGSGSQFFDVTFNGITEFRSTAEPCFQAEGKEKQITEFLYECFDSQYSKRACPFGRGARASARHFYVYTESIVLEVLSGTDPIIEYQT